MAFATNATLEPSTIERLVRAAAHMCIGKGWITIVRIDSVTGNIRECIPETIESVETLQYLGLTQSAASEAYRVFARECELTENANMEFIDWAKRHLENFPDCCENGTLTGWEAAMRNMGVQEFWRYGILHPRFANLRREHTARYWVIETMEKKWKHLVGLDQKVKSDLAKIEAVEHRIEQKARPLGGYSHQG